ncbi:hypothetical protein PBT90_18085 [Algoriphagus halophytocola]|uniref:Lipoprotein n=1 Tax=Algoriphagus halophytocola TaxID=2991499 RepID=A0ABY6MG72_9BACT|nr:MULTISPECIES: hypothetical protein [unclassified Algoriphagus]UZD21427.1 hypothetical protein OM944_12215 [Algoriphagus sp. TR-M5]WBL42639.1 hypothetical protein PBT90_18085 [Algoriphagus sp. TR-M9]
MKIFSRSFWLLAPLALVLFSCQEKEGPCGCTYIDTSFRFNVVNDDQVDLLDPSNPDHLVTRDLVVSFLLDGEKVEVYDSKINHLRSYPKIIEPEPLAGVDKYMLNVILNSSEDEEIPTTYLEWKDGSADKLEAEFSYSGNSVMIRKLWLNEDLIWDMQNDGEKPIYELVKDFDQ